MPRPKKPKTLEEEKEDDKDKKTDGNDKMQMTKEKKEAKEKEFVPCMYRCYENFQKNGGLTSMQLFGKKITSKEKTLYFFMYIKHLKIQEEKENHLHNQTLSLPKILSSITF